VLVDIRPEPSDVERAAIVVALERLLADDRPGQGQPGWWHAGLNESVEDEEERF
jgi:hypothetical protein